MEYILYVIKSKKGYTYYCVTFLVIKPGIDLLSHTKICSIIGEEELDFRVRKGIGYSLFSMDARKFASILIDRGRRSFFIKETRLTDY